MIDAIKMVKRDGFTYYRCPACHIIVSNMVVFTEWDFYNAIPRYCPCCRLEFGNGGKILSD